ncbi:hypothetical protein D3C78_1694430 [compost metagenome]
MINRRRFNDGAFGTYIAGREGHRRAQAFLLGAFWAKDDAIGVNPFVLQQMPPHAVASLRRLPPIQRFAYRMTRYRKRFLIQYA